MEGGGGGTQGAHSTVRQRLHNLLSLLARRRIQHVDTVVASRYYVVYVAGRLQSAAPCMLYSVRLNRLV